VLNRCIGYYEYRRRVLQRAEGAGVELALELWEKQWSGGELVVACLPAESLTS
jgi:hypothetical protein